MSRGHGRKGISTRRRSASSSNGVTLSPGGEHKTDETAKLESRSDGVKQTEEAVTMGLTQSRKPEDDDLGNSSALNGCLVRHTPISLCALLELDLSLQRILEPLNDKVPLANNNNSSMPQPAPSSPTKGQYMNRFGRIRAIDIVDLTQVRIFKSRARFILICSVGITSNRRGHAGDM
jgi:hypothetical protein